MGRADPIRTRLTRGAVHRTIPRPLRRPLLGGFARAVGADLSEADPPLDAYRTLADFLVRRHPDGSRPWRADPSAAGVPVDGVVAETGVVEGGRGPAVEDLLGDPEQAARFEGGVFAVVGLAFRHPRRLRAPTGGLVQALGRAGRGVVGYVDGPCGHVGIAAIGAAGVAADPDAGLLRRLDPPRPVAAGDDLLAVPLADRVVVLFEPGGVALDPHVAPGREVRAGEPLARPSPAILFLCVANSARSQMAEGLARTMAPPGTEIHSAGSEPGALHPLAVEAMAEIGIDLTGHRSKPIEAVPTDRVGVVVTLCAEEVCPVFPGEVERLHWPIDDPAAATGSDSERRAAFRRARDEIRERLLDFFEY